MHPSPSHVPLPLHPLDRPALVAGGGCRWGKTGAWQPGDLVGQGGQGLPRVLTSPLPRCPFCLCRGGAQLVGRPPWSLGGWGTMRVTVLVAQGVPTELARPLGGGLGL